MDLNKNKDLEIVYPEDFLTAKLPKLPKVKTEEEELLEKQEKDSKK